MNGINKVIILGTLGRDPEMKQMVNGNFITNLAVATSEKWQDKKTNQPVEKTEWHRIVLFGKVAEIAGQYLKKGRQVYIEGKIQTRKWQDQTGQDRYSTEIVVDNNGMMQMVGGSGYTKGDDDSDQSTASKNTQQRYDSNQTATAPEQTWIADNDYFNNNPPPF